MLGTLRKKGASMFVADHTRGSVVEVRMVRGLDKFLLERRATSDHVWERFGPPIDPKEAK